MDAIKKYIFVKVVHSKENNLKLKKKKYAVVLLCSAILGTFVNTVSALETSNPKSKISNLEELQSEENVSDKTSESSKDTVTPSEQNESPESDGDEGGTKQNKTDQTVSSDHQEKSNIEIDENDEQMNHKMGTYAKGYGLSDVSGRPMLRAEGVPTIYSNDKSLPSRDVVDIASWQSWMTQNDFNLLKQQGIKAICVKITEGTSYKNPYAANQIKMAKNAGLIVSVYHCSRFSSNAGAISEANFFAKTANELGLSKGTLMVNDAEDGDMQPKKVDLTITCNTFAEQLKNNGFKNVLHYASASWVGVGNVPLEYDKMGGINNFWIAQYDYAKPSSSNLKWRDKGGAWQYSSNMILAGGSKSEFLDVSIDYKGRFTGAIANTAMTYDSHVEGIGWQGYTTDNTIGGTTGSGKRLEAFRISYDSSLGSGGISYASSVKGQGWQNEVTTGNISGTIAQSKPLEALKIRLTGAVANKYDIYYRVHSSNIGWLGWAKNGEAAGTGNSDTKIEAYQVHIVLKGSIAPGATLNAYVDRTKIMITEESHVSTFGWQPKVFDAMQSGTTGQSKAVEAIKLGFTKATPVEGNISIQSHIAGVGWEQGWKTNGQQSGTTGQSKAIEAIRVQLTGKISEQYDIYYRVHSQNYGWLGWAKNGENAGTQGLSLRIEAYEIRVVEKGGDTPAGTNQSSFVKGEPVPAYSYTSHVQGIGWMPSVVNLGVSGTTGQSRRIEAIQINNPMLEYRTHLAEIGWTSWTSKNNQVSGTTGQSRSAQALSIRLKPQYIDKFDVYYRAHSASQGWLGWTKNGADAGTKGYNLQMEVYQIRILPKNSGLSPTLSTAFKAK